MFTEKTDIKKKQAVLFCDGYIKPSFDRLNNRSTAFPVLSTHNRTGKANQMLKYCVFIAINIWVVRKQVI